MASREGSMGGGAAFRSMIYNTFIRRSSVYAATMVFAGMVTTNAYFKLTDGVWKSINKGVSVASFHLSIGQYPNICCDGMFNTEILGGSSSYSPAQRRR